MVRHLVAEQTPRQWDRVDHRVGELVAAAASKCCLQKRHVEAGVVGDEDRVGDELEQCGQHRLDPRCGSHHRLGDPGEYRHLGWNQATRVHEGLKPCDLGAGVYLHRSDLGDGVVVAARSGRFEIDDAERDLVQWCSEIVEADLARGRH